MSFSSSPSFCPALLSSPPLIFSAPAGRLERLCSPPLSSSLDLFSINVSYSFLRQLTACGSAAITHNQALISVC